MGLKCSHLPAQTSSLLLEWTPCTQLCAGMRLKQEGFGTAHSYMLFVLDLPEV